MKKISFYKYALMAASLFVFSACSDDDDPEPKPEPEPEPEVVFGPKESATFYTDSSTLLLTYNGNPIIGKSVTVTPNLQNPSNPTLTFAGSPVDLMDVVGGMGMSSRADEMPFSVIPTPGVLPGTPELSINVNLNETDGSFSGDGSTDFCTYKYSGIWSEQGVQCQFTDVKLIDQTLGGTSWKNAIRLNPDYMEGFEDFYPEYLTNGISVVWDSSVDLEIFEGLSFPIQTIISLAFSMPILDGVTINDALAASLAEINFTEDGNIIASYLDEETGQYATSPKNIAQYVISNGTLLLFLNPQAIIYNTLVAGRADGEGGAEGSTEAIMQAVMAVAQNYIPMVRIGFPLQYSANENDMSLTLDTQFMMPLLNTAAAVLSNESVIEMIKASIMEDEGMADYAEIIVPMLSKIPAVVAGTTKMEVSLNLTKK